MFVYFSFLRDNVEASTLQEHTPHLTGQQNFVSASELVLSH